MIKHYIELFIDNISPETSGIIIAILNDEGFDGFEQTEFGLIAFIDAANFNQNKISKLAEEFSFSFRTEKVEEQNWNALWESNFEPVVVDDFVTVRANFHQIKKNTQHEIIITPKMSFGTGHHATTFMMMQQMRSLNFSGKKVYDFGTGTGVLAILAEELGATDILAVDNDDWSISNAQENIVANNALNIKIEKAESAAAGKDFDIVLANINKNVIIENADKLYTILNKNGQLLLSGLLKEDEKEITKIFSRLDLLPVNTLYNKQWICMLWRKK
ncbi:MAG: 50S ribosomal protein L11 methyltransferase [Arachidicoccus sp.]|nr:50S ribosomal protein L11 methyltransferase [Arachidicoccus sp.]